jgi:hypothetical protein
MRQYRIVVANAKGEPRYAWISPTCRSPINLEHVEFLSWDDDVENHDYFLVFDEFEQAMKHADALMELDCFPTWCKVIAVDWYFTPDICR